MAKKKEITRTEIKELGRIKTLDRLGYRKPGEIIFYNDIAN